MPGRSSSTSSSNFPPSPPRLQAWTDADRGTDTLRSACCTCNSSPSTLTRALKKAQRSRAPATRAAAGFRCTHAGRLSVDAAAFVVCAGGDGEAPGGGGAACCRASDVREWV